MTGAEWLTHDETVRWIMRSRRCGRAEAERLLEEGIDAGRISFKATHVSPGRPDKTSVWRVRDGIVVEEQ